MSKNITYNRELILANDSKEGVHNGRGGKAPNGWDRKLADHTPHPKAGGNESELEVRQGSKLSEPASTNVLPPANLHSPTALPSPPNSATTRPRKGSNA